jgi:hypothetical protein
MVDKDHFCIPDSSMSIKKQKRCSIKWYIDIRSEL